MAVLEETQGLQTPWDASSLIAPFSFVPGEVIAPEELAERQMWASVSASRDPLEIMLFLRTYPESLRASEARQLMIDVMAEAEGGAVAPEAVAEAAAEPEPEVAEAAEVVPVADESVVLSDAEADVEAADVLEADAREASVATAAAEPARTDDAAAQPRTEPEVSPPSLLAENGCPLVLGPGVVLTYADGVLETYRQHPDREAIVTVRGVQDSQTIYELELLKGAHVISNDPFVDDEMDPDASLAYDFNRPLSEIPVPVAGQTWTATTLLTTGGETFEEEQIQIYSATADITLGQCSYPAVAVDVTYDNGYREGLIYLPSLGISYLDWSQDGDQERYVTEVIGISGL